MSSPASADPIRCAAHLSTLPDTEAAVTEGLAAIRERLGGAASLVMLFASAHHAERLESQIGEFTKRSGPITSWAAPANRSSGTVARSRRNPP